MKRVIKRLLTVTLLGLLAASGAQAEGAAAQGEGFSVHEWGLLYFPAGRAPARLQSSAHHPALGEVRGMAHPPGMAGKPVIFFHPEAGFDPAQTIEVEVSLHQGTLREIWPTPKGGPQPKMKRRFTWKGLKIQPQRPCGAELAPLRDGPACASLRLPHHPGQAVTLAQAFAQCEAWEMSLYMPQIPHCIEAADGVRTPALVYNGAFKPRGHPLKLKWRADAPLESRLSAAAHPLRWVYVTLGPDIYRFDALKPGAPKQLSQADAKLTAATLIPELHEALKAQGLTALEATAFTKAWAGPLKDTPQAWSALGFLEPKEIEARAPLKIKPAPRAVARVMAFMIEPSPKKQKIEAAARPKRARLREGHITLRGALSVEIFKRVIRRHRGQLLRCYALEGGAPMKPKGKIVMRGVIDPMGRVVQVKAIENTTGREEPPRCLAQRLKRARFPKPKDGAPVHFTLPLLSRLE